jgi:hypothetical protein
MKQAIAHPNSYATPEWNRVLGEVEREFAAELSQAGWWRRWRLRAKINAEATRRMQGRPKWNLHQV